MKVYVPVCTISRFVLLHLKSQPNCVRHFHHFQLKRIHNTSAYLRVQVKTAVYNIAVYSLCFLVRGDFDAVKPSRQQMDMQRVSFYTLGEAVLGRIQLHPCKQGHRNLVAISPFPIFNTTQIMLEIFRFSMIDTCSRIRKSNYAAEDLET